MKLFADVSSLAASHLTVGQLTGVKGVGDYLIKASGSGITLANGNVAEPVASGTAVNVKQFGAVGDGVADDTAAFRACYTYVEAAQVNSQSTVFDYTSPKMFIPSGKYLITGSITQATGSADSADGFIVEGENSILLGGTGTFNFFEFRTGCEIKNLVFQGGGRVAYIQTGNSDSAQIKFTDCVFQNQNINHIASDSNSASTIVNVTRCKMYQINDTGTGTKTMAEIQCDVVNFRDCWIYYGGTGVPFKTYKITNFNNNLFVPNYLLGSRGTQTAWIDNYGSLYLEGNRMGAEGGGCTVLRNYESYTDPSTQSESKVWVVNNLVTNDTGPMFEFYALPSAIDISGNRGYESTEGLIYFDPSISLANIRATMLRGGIKLEDINGRIYYSVQGSVDTKSYMAQAVKTTSRRPKASDLIISRQTDLSGNNLIGGSSGSSFTTALVGGRTGRQYDGAGDTIESFFLNSTATTAITSALASGEWCTVVYHVEIASQTPVPAWIDNNEKPEFTFLKNGVNIICAHAYYDGTNAPNVEVGFDMENASDVLRIGPVRVFKNIYQVDDMKLTMDGDTVPTANAPTVFFEGDTLMYDTLAAGGFMGEVAVDDAGTWKTFGAISV